MALRVLSTPDHAVADVIFVHGLRMARGRPETDWRRRRDPDSFWPEWLQRDFPNVRVAVLSYNAAASRWFGSSMHLEDRAANVLATLRANGVGERPAIFVTHSLGGLVVKEMLLQSRDAPDADDRRVAAECYGVVFLATPHTGSAWANLATGVRALRGSRAITTLLNNDPHLTGLSRRYRNWVDQKDNLGHLVLTETQPFAGLFLVVTAGSADPGIPGARVVPVDADHNSIATPESRDETVYEQTARFVRSIVAGLAPESATADDALASPADMSRASHRARAVSTPDILPSMERDDLVRRTAACARPIQVLFGEGGLGKSVVAGQIFDTLDGVRPVILIACSMLRLSQRSYGAEEIDEALAVLADGMEPTLTASVAALPTRPVVIIDTVDLLLNQTNGDEIAELLTRLSQASDVIVTCRAREWHDLLAPFTQTLELDSAAVPPLDREQVLAWVDAYLEAERLSPGDSESFRESVESALEVRRGLAVLGVPLRLAMACQLYVTTGGLPDNLTATRLYSEYWSGRVSAERDGRRFTAGANAKERAALQVARGIWAESTNRFIEDVAPIDDIRSTNELISEGVLGRMGGRLHFFHQTFAEFSVAKLLAVEGASGDFERLGTGLRSRTSGYWGVIGHLLLQDLSSQRFEVIWGIVPIDFVEGSRVSIIGALSRGDVEHGEQLLRTIAMRQPEEFASAVDLLEDAGDDYVLPVIHLLTDILPVTQSYLTGVVHALSALIMRLPPSESAVALAKALDRLIARYRARDPLIDTEAQRLLHTVLLDGAYQNSSLLLIAIARYRALPIAGRRVVCSAVKPADSYSRSGFLDVALTLPVPPSAVEPCVDLMRAEWHDPAARVRRGWHSWREVLSQDLPDLWDAVQVRVAGFGRERGEVHEMVSECVQPRLRIPRDRLLNATLFVTDEHPLWVADALLGSKVDEDRLAVTALAQLLLQLRPTLDTERGAALIAMLRPVAHIEPRRAWPALAKVSTADPAQLASVLSELSMQPGVRSRDPQWAGIVASAVDAVADALGVTGTQLAWGQLKPLMQQFGDSSAERLAGVWGMMAHADTDARARVDEVFDSNRQREQKAMTSAILRTREELPWAERSTGLGWTTSLLRVRNDGVVTRLAEDLRRDASTPSWTVAGTTVVVERLQLALDREEDPQTSGSLMALIATIIHDGRPDTHPTQAQVRALLETYRGYIAATLLTGEQPLRLNAMYNQYADALRRLVKPVLGIDAMGQLVIQLLLEVDAGAVAQGAKRTLAKTLAALVRSAPDRWALIESQWASVPESNKQAIAETVLNGLVPDRDGTAMRLAARADCPPSVAAYLHRRTA